MFSLKNYTQLIVFVELVFFMYKMIGTVFLHMTTDESY